MPKKPAPRGKRSARAKPDRAHKSKSAKIQDLPIEAGNLKGADAVVGGGTGKQPVSNTPKESVSFNFGSVNQTYTR